MAKLLGIKELCEFWQVIKTNLDAKQNTLTAGNNITISGNTISATDTTYSDATTTTAGLMSAADKTKLNGIASGAEVNVQSDWNETNTSADSYILNKPIIPDSTSDLTNDSGFITASDPVFGNYVLKAGDTMTGNLTIETAADSMYTTKRTDLSMRAGTPVLSATESIGGLQMRDSNDELNGYIETKRARVTNDTYLQVYHRRYSSDGSTSKSIGYYMGLTENLEPFVTFSDDDTRDAWAEALDVVKRSGDTMTGGLTIESFLTLQSTTYEMGVTPVGGGWIKRLYFTDKNDESIGYLGYSDNTNGTAGMYLRSIKKINGTNYGHQLGLLVNSAGAARVAVTDPVAWRDGLGFGTPFTTGTAGSGTQNIPSGTTTNIMSRSLSAGRWLIIGQVAYNGNGAAGYRTAYIGSTATNSTYATAQVAGNPSGNTTPVAVTVREFTTTTTVYLNAIQGSGTACNVSKPGTHLQTIRLAPV